MADGASAIIGIVAFGLHAMHRVYEIIDNVKDAPADILALRQDANDVGNLLLQLQKSVMDSSVVPQRSALTDRYMDALSEIESFIDKVAGEQRDGEIQVKKLQWYLKNGRCEKLRRNLSSLKTSTIAIVAASTLTFVYDLQNTIIQLVESQDRLANAQEQSCALIDAFQSEHESWCAQQLAELANLRVLVEALLARDRDRVFFTLASSSGATQPPCNSGAPPAVSMPVSAPDIPISEICEAFTEDKHHGQTSQRASLVPRTLKPLTKSDLKRTLQCENPCACCCHDTRLTRATPYWGSSWFGNLYLPRSFFHRSFASCNVQTCRRTHKSCQLAKIKFFFPSWFLSVEMKIRLEAFPVHFYLQTPRRVPNMSPIFRCVVRMDIEGVRKLLVSGEASVNDVNEEGWGVLHFAVRHISNHSCEQVSAMLQFLVDEGAHTEWEEEQFHRTPLRLLQQHGSLQLQKPDIEGSVVRSVQVQIAGPIFHEDLVDAWEDWLEESDFTDVHRAVLTHRTRDVCLKDRLVGTPVADISAPCRIGMTPLDWGMFMDVPDVVQTLLDCGADVHKGYPLHRAAFWGDVQALKYLVHAGADICLQDDRGRTPLHEAAYYGKAEYVEELVRMGADILGLDILAQYGDTILDEARAGRKYFDAMSRLTYGHDEVVRVLSNLQAWRDSRSTLRHSREPVTEVEVLEDLKMPGSFPAG